MIYKSDIGFLLTVRNCLLILFLLCRVGWISAQPPKREMRGVWIATVENIDWPSAPGKSTEQQRKELTSLLDLVKECRLNTVVLQIRPCADALYPSVYEPWSQWLTGTQGKAPDPFYDPLQFAIEECRKRGLDIHVWLNPYRALRDTAKNVTATDHITNTHPEMFLTYGATKYFDPGLPATRDFVARVVSDIVRRYDIDAIHMDDYFYPYRILGKEFPDGNSFSQYPDGYRPDQKDDWRRHNVDLIIKQLHDSVRSIKPWVEFGISPFGVWRNKDRDSTGSLTRAGQTNYDDLFADILKWQQQGWIDYVVPQLYWHIGFAVADYAVLARWWNDHTFGCPLYIGQAFYRIDRKSTVKDWRKSDQIIKQILLNRSLPQIKGSIYFSAKYLRNNPGKLKQNLRRGYPFIALPINNDRINAVVPDAPGMPLLSEKGDSVMLSWTKGRFTKNFIIYKYRIGQPADFSDPGNIFEVTSDTTGVFKSKRRTSVRRNYYVITAQSITNTESAPVFFRKP